MLAWINISGNIYLIVLAAVFLQITTDADAVDTDFKFCPKGTITVGTRADKARNITWCTGCDKLRNCTSVFGSVHIKGISFNDQNEHLRKELRFPHLREITGHLIVTFVYGVPSLSDILPNLAVIHGRVEYLFEGYALVVYHNKGLQHLGLDSLTLIRQGDTRIEFNQKLCYLDRIRWQSLRADSETKKYELVVNGNSKNCFEKCSDSCRTPSGHGSSGYKYCWGRGPKNCQKLCHSKCGSSGCEDKSQDKCCDKECLGGCSRANSPDHCNACQHFRLPNGSCVPTCPPDMNELENFICEKQCPPKIYAELNGKCYKDCPIGYKKNVDQTKCIKCEAAEDQCRRECYSNERKFPIPFKIRTLADSVKLKGCQVAKAPVHIEIRKAPGGTNIAKELNEHLGALEEIHGHLVVRQSYPLISLNFFKNLTKIVSNGRGFSSKDYALAISDNPNLESLWDFHPDFKIIGSQSSPEKDGVFIELNPRLCHHKISPLIHDVLKMNQSDPGVDVSKTTNGNDRICGNVTYVNINIKARDRCPTPLCVQVSWPTKIGDNDYRNVLLYSLWFRETEQTNLNEYDDFDACNSDDVWNRQDRKAGRGNKLEMTVRGLKPYTLYAFRMESIVIAGRAIKSNITYFKTKQLKPSVPRNLEVSFLSSSSLQVKWRKPFFPNGDITHYVVRYHESQSSYLWNLKTDWCENSNFPIFVNKKKEENFGKRSTNDSCPVTNVTCDCPNEKKNVITPDLKEALFAKEFQDQILNTVFSKNDNERNNNNRPRPPPVTPRPNVVTNKATPFSQGCDYNSKNSSCSNSKTKTTSNPTTIVSTLPQPTPIPIITRNTTSRTIVLTELKYFTDYTVEVCACNSGAGCGENKMFVTQCATAIGRTDKNDNADNVGNVSVHSTSEEYTLSWEAPVNPNGAVLRYDVWILNYQVDENKTSIRTTCVQSSKTEYVRKKPPFGEYRAKVRAITPVGNGSWSNEVSFQIKDSEPEKQTVKGENMVTVIGVSIAAILVAVLFFAVLTYSMIQRQKKNENGAGVIYSSTNPEYWNCAEVYVPDEWEVPRENITLIRELGNGSFGMVWEGEAIGILPGVDSCKVAVKTVSDNSSIRDKVEFLKEASIMKAFNCNHVLRLLGVVSAGDPVLVIMELMENGDLKSFLRRRRPDEEEENDNSLPPPTDVELYKMAAEIADGMAYLADRKFVHRDLAARNCMVSGHYTCKIGDFGMARDVYETDYYRKGGKGFLPVRWMAPESLKDGVFCSASDVWSYGVVLWEMATLAEQPYQGKSNEEVMKYVLDGNVMNVPEDSPPKLTEIMFLCWTYKSKQRPSFLSIVKRLEEYVSIDFIERSFYHNERTRKDTDTSSLVSLGTENDNLSELQEQHTEPKDEDLHPRESFV